MKLVAVILGALLCGFSGNGSTFAVATPVTTTNGLVVTQERQASEIGARILRRGGNAMDAAVATAFALAVTHPAAGNIGGGGFLVYRSADGTAVTYDFRETAPALAHATMFLREGKYDPALHHHSHVSVGVPGTVAGLHLAWREQGTLPWEQLVAPAIVLARNGFGVTAGLSGSLKRELPRLRRHAASLAQFTRNGVALEPGETLKQTDLARTLTRIAEAGPPGFYEGETAELIEREMRNHGGLLTRADLKAYAAKRRDPVRGNYRGYEIISMGPPSSGGVALVQMLNLLEAYDLRPAGFGAEANLHVMIESMRRAFADRARFLADSDFVTVPLDRLVSKPYANELRRTISAHRAAVSAPDVFEWPSESAETTHLSVVDRSRNAVALTYTLEESYGSAIVVPGAGFLLNNEMGDFNAQPGLTTTNGLIGTAANLAAPRKRMLSSMTPTIIARDGRLVMVTGTPGGRTIINTVLQTIVNIIDFEMNAQEAVNAPRFHHQWLPDVVRHERGFAREILMGLEKKGHRLAVSGAQGVAQIIVGHPTNQSLAAGSDPRDPDGAAIAE